MAKGEEETQKTCVCLLEELHLLTEGVFGERIGKHGLGMTLQRRAPRGHFPLTRNVSSRCTSRDTSAFEVLGEKWLQAPAR